MKNSKIAGIGIRKTGNTGCHRVQERMFQVIKNEQVYLVMLGGRTDKGRPHLWHLVCWRFLVTLARVF